MGGTAIEFPDEFTRLLLPEKMLVATVKRIKNYTLLHRLGSLKATLLITLCSVLVSVSITVTSILIVYDASVLPFGIALSVLLPGTISPLIAYFFFRLLAQVEQARHEKELAVLELQDALANVKRLSGLLPICASCKKIRDDEGYWHQVEIYIHTHTEADFSHSICPDCIQTLYPTLRRYQVAEEMAEENVG